MPQGGASADPARRVARGNNLDLVRFVAASLVLVSHSYTLTGRGGEPAWLGYETIGGLAVAVFFVISGYLVTASWQRRPHIVAFARNRALRIVPAFIGVVLISLLVLGPLLTALPIADYFLHPQARWYLVNLTFTRLDYALPAVFMDNPYPHVVNGSLWTLPIEVGMYLVLGGLGVLQLLRGRFVVVFAVGLAALWFGGGAGWLARSAPALPAVLPAAHVVHLGLWFFTGSLFWLFRQHIRYHAWVAVALLAGAWWLPGIGGRVALHLAIPYAVLWFAQLDLGQARNFGRHGDFSYGLYLYAFPVQQTIAHFGGARWPLPVYIAVCFALTLACAMASWRWIEAPALRLKQRVNIAQPRALHDPRQIGA